VSELEGEYGRDFPSQKLGEAVMQRLRQLDAVAYVRFVSVYRQFDDVDQFIEEIKRLAKS
jgi:transcriptional repressor NrdR